MTDATAARLALPDRDFERLQAADLLHARNFMLQCAIRDAQRALERGDADAAMHALCRVEPQMGGVLWPSIETLPDGIKLEGRAVLLARHDRVFGWVIGWGRWVSVGWIARGLYDPPGDLGLAHPTHWFPIPFPQGPADVA